MYRNWPQQWMVSQDIGLASPPPAVPYYPPGSPCLRRVDRHYMDPTQMEVNLLWQSVLRPTGRVPCATPPSPRWSGLPRHLERRESADSGRRSRASTPPTPAGQRQGTKRGCSDSPGPDSPFQEPQQKRGRQVAADSSPGRTEQQDDQQEQTPDSAEQEKQEQQAPADTVSQQIQKIFESCRQGETVYKNKLLLRDRVLKVLEGLYRSCQLRIVGSSCTGFASDTSDVDICLFLTEDFIDQQHEATHILAQVERRLAKDPDYDIQLIRAKVPILRFKSASTGIQVDLNCNNLVGIRNTHLLQCYSSVDDRVCPLIVLVKLWAQSHDINDACRATLSSYSLVLMVIHYLQCGEQPAVLPNLQRLYQVKFRPTQPVQLIPKHDNIPNFVSRNNDSLGQLFLGFLRYYAREFNFQTQVASVRTGTRLYKYQCRSVYTYNNSPGMWKYVCVEEPFDRTNTARAVHRVEAFQAILLAFQDSYSALATSSDLRRAFGSKGRQLFDDDSKSDV